jgi:hypothetical protein
MRFKRKPKFSVTGVSFPVIGGGVTWSDKTDERARRAVSERSAAFTELWRIAQDAHIGVRNNFGSADELSDVHRRLNVLLIERAPALEESDVELAQDFLTALGEFIGLLRPLPGATADHVREELSTTVPARRLRLGDLDVLQESYSRMSRYDELLTIRYRQVVFGESA